MTKEERKGDKFRVRADLALFEAMEKDGRLSEAGFARKTHISPTTVHYAMQRIRERDFFKVKAVPRLERFQEIPLGIIGFVNVHPPKIHELKDKYGNAPEVLQFFHDDKDFVLFAMESSVSALTRMFFDIMEYVEQKPCIYTYPQPSPNVRLLYQIRCWM
jgi:DNA-binding Lrp family transcriptional regulator